MASRVQAEKMAPALRMMRCARVRVCVCVVAFGKWPCVRYPLEFPPSTSSSLPPPPPFLPLPPPPPLLPLPPPSSSLLLHLHLFVLSLPPPPSPPPGCGAVFLRPTSAGDNFHGAGRAEPVSDPEQPRDRRDIGGHAPEQLCHTTEDVRGSLLSLDALLLVFFFLYPNFNDIV